MAGEIKDESKEILFEPDTTLGDISDCNKKDDEDKDKD